MDPVPGDELGWVSARCGLRRAAEHGEVEVVRAATAPAARGQRPVSEAVKGRERDGLDDRVVDVGVKEGESAAIVSPELAEHHPQRTVVLLGDLVEPRDAAGGGVVVAFIACWVQGQLLRLAADW